MKIYELTEELAEGIQEFENPERVLDSEILDLLQDATRFGHPEDQQLACELAHRSCGLNVAAMFSFLQGFDLAFQYMELARRAGDLKEFEKSLGVEE